MAKATSIRTDFKEMFQDEYAEAARADHYKASGGLWQALFLNIEQILTPVYDAAMQEPADSRTRLERLRCFTQLWVMWRNLGIWLKIMTTLHFKMFSELIKRLDAAVELWVCMPRCLFACARFDW